MHVLTGNKLEDNIKLNEHYKNIGNKNKKRDEEFYMPSIKIYGKKDRSTHVRMKIAQSVKDLTSLLLDSGCAISIIKFSVLKPDVNIFPDQKVELVGITGSIVSKGAAFLLLKVGRKQVIHEFQVINDTDANTAGFDGILGQNIIENCIIDFVNMTMSYAVFCSFQNATAACTHTLRNSLEKNVVLLEFLEFF